VQYRVGETGAWTNVPGGYLSKATTGPSLATFVTIVPTTPARGRWNAPV
jgi:hypothetical protein